MKSRSTEQFYFFKLTEYVYIYNNNYYILKSSVTKFFSQIVLGKNIPIVTSVYDGLRILIKRDCAALNNNWTHGGIAMKLKQEAIYLTKIRKSQETRLEDTKWILINVFPGVTLRKWVTNIPYTFSISSNNMKHNFGRRLNMRVPVARNMYIIYSALTLLEKLKSFFFFSAILTHKHDENSFFKFLFE